MPDRQTQKVEVHAKKTLRRTASLLEQAQRTAHERSRVRRAEGKAMRKRLPLDAHTAFEPAADRPDPVALLESQDAVRLESLVPIRFGRMAASPFAFYRGAAIVMTDDLARTPTTGWLVQACGDAHLDNFGAFGTAQGDLVFDINDFDETYPAPWEWDVKRLAASVVLGCREIGAAPGRAKRVARASVAGYREAVRRLADIGVMARWRSVISVPAALALAGASERQIDKVTAAALRRTSAGSFPKLTTLVGGKRVLRESPPLVVRITEDEERDRVRAGFDAYKSGLRHELQLLLDRFELIDFARKVVGVGSVGMPAYIALLLSADGDPLFLQVKAAVASVLEPHVSTKDAISAPGERVVVGQRLMQTAGDPLLGWVAPAGGLHYYVRELRDMKLSVDLTTMSAKKLTHYATACGTVLAHAHSRTGDPALIAGYLGKSDSFDTAVAAFAVAYADQTESDHAALQHAIGTGRLTATIGA